MCYKGPWNICYTGQAINRSFAIQVADCKDDHLDGGSIFSSVPWQKNLKNDSPDNTANRDERDKKEENGQKKREIWDKET